MYHFKSLFKLTCEIYEEGNKMKGGESDVIVYSNRFSLRKPHLYKIKYGKQIFGVQGIEVTEIRARSQGETGG
jgi:hypothetical protein